MTQTPDPREQKLNEILDGVKKLQKEIKEKDERIKELEATLEKYETAMLIAREDAEKFCKENKELLSHQKGVDGLVEALRNIALSCKLSWFTKEGARTIAKKALSHYQSLRETKGPDAEHRPLSDRTGPDDKPSDLNGGKHDE